MIVGVTGSHIEITEAQYEVAGDMLAAFADELHHGDCVGVDAAVDNAAALLGIRRVIHPPMDPKARAFCQGEVILPELPYLTRNRDIVNAVDGLLVIPHGPEQRRSGTWMTCRYARQERVPTLIIFPDGTTLEELPWPTA